MAPSASFTTSVEGPNTRINIGNEEFAGRMEVIVDGTFTAPCNGINRASAQRF